MNHTIADWIGIFIGVLGLGFAIFEHQKRAKVETITKNTLRRLAGEMRVIFANANWADGHLRKIGHLFAQPEPDLIEIRAQALDAARDAVACARQLGMAHSHIKNIQESLFNDSGEILPQIVADDVRAAQAQAHT